MKRLEIDYWRLIIGSCGGGGFAIELDVDRVAYVAVADGEILLALVDEDMHFPCEPERRRGATAAEVEEIRGRLAAGGCRKIPALPSWPAL